MPDPNFLSPPAMPMPSGSPLAQIHSDLVELTKAMNRLTQQVAASFPTFVSVPANSAATGVAGQMSYDAGFFYICTGAGAWRRVAIAAF